MAHLTVEGTLNSPPRPDDEHSTTARFSLHAHPSGEHATRWPVTCHITDTHIAHTVLTELTPGTALRAHGYLHEHHTPDIDTAPVLAVVSLEILTDSPAPHPQCGPAVDIEAVIQQRGAYIPDAEGRLNEIAALISRRQSTTPGWESLVREIHNLLTRPVYSVPASLWCPRCRIADVEEYDLPISHIDDTAPIARCRRCTRTWTPDPAAARSCPACGGSGDLGARYGAPSCPCSESYHCEANH